MPDLKATATVGNIEVVATLNKDTDSVTVVRSPAQIKKDESAKAAKSKEGTSEKASEKKDAAPTEIIPIRAYWFGWKAFYPNTEVFKAPEAKKDAEKEPKPEGK